MTMAEVEVRVSGAEFAEWIEHWKREPWGDFRIDLAGAQITSMLANINRDTKKKPEGFTVDDFMPFIERPKKPTPAQQLRAQLIHLVKKAA